MALPKYGKICIMPGKAANREGIRSLWLTLLNWDLEPEGLTNVGSRPARASKRNAKV